MASFLLVIASCFALGGTGVNADALATCMLVPIAIAIMVEWRHEKWQNGNQLESLMHDDKKLAFPERIKAGYSLITIVNDALLMAVLIFFTGSMLIPYLDPFHGASWDATTWRFIATCILTVVAFIVFLRGFAAKNKDGREPNASGNHQTSKKASILLVALIWSLVSILGFVIIFYFESVLAMKTSFDETMLYASMTVLIVFLVQGIQFTRAKSGTRASSSVSNLQCLRAGIIAGMLLGIGAPALMLFVRVGMNFEAAVFAVITVVLVMILELPLLVRRRFRT